MTTRHCSACGHETAGRRKVRPDLCGPCFSGKPVGWWDDLPAKLAKLGMPAALLAWGLAGGGGGCSGGPPAPVIVPFGCSTTASTIHVAYAFGPGNESEQIEPAFSIWDCEWNGVNDAGPLDTDEGDPQADPRSGWDYRIEPDGSFFNEQIAWSNAEGVRVEVTTVPALTLAVEQGVTYALDVQRGLDPPAEAYVTFVLQCPGEAERRWHDGDPPLEWTAAATATCAVQAVSGCHQQGAFGQSFGTCTDVFRVVR